MFRTHDHSGADPGFQVGGGGASLKKLRQAEGGAKIFGVFRVKNHDFTLQNLIFSNFKGGRGGAPGAPPGSASAIQPFQNLCKMQSTTYSKPLRNDSNNNSSA